MNIIFTIGLVLVVIVASLFCLSSSMCAVGSVDGARATYAFIALLSLGIAIGGVMLIGKINRKE